MITLTRTDSTHPDFVGLVQHLDAYLAKQDGDEHAFYNQFNKITAIKHVIVAHQNGIPVGCGAIKEYSEGTAEVKRMYTSPEVRGKGIATQILSELEKWAVELSFKKCILETGIRQPEAISLYKKCGYKIIPNYGQYLNIANSVCFEKEL